MLDFHNFVYVKFMSNNNLISCIKGDNKNCEIYIQANMTKKSFQLVERISNLLDLVHCDICELNDHLTRDENKYFITI